VAMAWQLGADQSPEHGHAPDADPTLRPDDRLGYEK
jgi:hypothetical protein